MTDATEFLFDDGEVKSQRYRIQKVVEEEVRRRNCGAADVSEAMLQLRKPTKYEQSIMNRIPERQAKNIVKPQVVCGKTYDGQGFLPSPSTVEFTDFDVGETYTTTVVITNVSRSFNAFKLKEVPKEVQDVIEVKYTPSSMMSAGMTAKVVVIFTPKENIDIHTAISFLGQTGGFRILVNCTRKRVVIQASPRCIDFGTTVVAEVVDNVLLIENSGALSTTMTIGGDFLPLLKETQTATTGKTRKLLSLNLQKLNNILIEPFSTLKLSLQYTPLLPSSIDSSMYLSFSNPEVADIVVFLKGSAVDVPVFISRNKELRLDCCFRNTLYRDTYTVRNTTKSAVLVKPETPNELAGSLEYVPKFGFVQPEGTFDFQVKFTPSSSLPDEINLSIPTTVAGQAMPIYFQLMASLTKQSVQLKPDVLSFGYTVVGEAFSQVVKVTNQSRLRSKMGFVNLPPAVDVSPRVYRFSPGEETEFTVSVCAPAAGPYSHTLKMQTDCGAVFSLPISGDAKAPPLHFSSSRLVLPACPVFDSVSVSTLLTNTTDSLQRFAFDVNALYNLEVSPSHGEVQPGSSHPIVVTFRPTSSGLDGVTLRTDEEIEADVVAEEQEAEAERLRANPPPPQPKKRSKAEEEADRVEKERLLELQNQRIAAAVAQRRKERDDLAALKPWEVSAPEETFSRHRTLVLPCFIDKWLCKSIFLEVRSTVVLSALEVLAEDNEHLSVEGGRLTLNFGSVPARQSCTRAITFRAAAAIPLRVETQPLDPFGAFKVVRTLPPELSEGCEGELAIQFVPANHAAYRQALTVQTSTGSRVHLELVGEGLPAMLLVTEKGQTQDLDAETVALGSCLCDDVAEHVLVASNESPFPLTVEASFDAREVLRFNPNGSIPFQISPNRFTLPAHGKTELLVSFNPQMEAEFAAAVKLQFGGAGTGKSLKFRGFGWEHGLYVQFPVSIEKSDVFSGFGESSNRAGSSALHPIVIPVSAAEGAAEAITLVVGNCKGSTNGDFTIEGLNDGDSKNGWKIDNPKATVQPGQRLSVDINFSPTTTLLDSLPLKNIGIVSVLQLRLTLRGGNPSSETVYHVQVKGTATR